MPFDVHGNLCYGVVDTAPSPALSGTSITLQFGNGNDFPDPAGIGYEVTCWPADNQPLLSNAEILRVTAKAGDVFTITRAQGGTTAKAIQVGWAFALTITKKVVEDLEAATANYAGTNGAITGGSITVNTSGVSVSLPAYLTTAMASNRGSDFVQAAAVFNGTNATGTIASNAISVSVAAQSTQSALKGLGVSNTGQTAGNTGVSTGIDYVLAGSGSITLSQSTAAGGPNTAWIQHPAWLTTAMASNRGSDFVQATAVFNGTNATGTIASNAISVSVAAQSNQSAIKALGVSNTGQTAGNTGVSTGIDWVLAGSQSLTLSQSTAAGGPNTIWFQHPAWLTTARASTDAIGLNTAKTNVTWTVNSSGISLDGGNYLTTQSTQFLALTLGGNTAGTTTFHATNNASIFLHGGNNITLSGNGSSVTISGPNAAGAQTGISGIVVSDTTYTSGTVSFSNAGNITISSSVNGATQYIRLSGNAAQTTQSAIKGFGVSNTGQTAGNTGISTGIDWVLAGSQSITLSQSTAGGGPNTVWIQHPAWLTTAALSGDTTKYVQAWELTGNTAGTTSSAQGTKLYFEGGNSITVSGTSNTIKLSVGNYLTTARASTDAIGLNTAKTNVTWTVNSSGISLDGGNYLTTQSTQFLALTIAGNTAGTSTFHATNNASLFFNGGNNITLSGNGSTVTISAAAQTNQTIGLYASSNTTLTSSGTADARSLSFRGVGAASVGVSASEVIISVAAGGQSNQSVGWYASSNTTLTSSGTADARSLSVRGIDGISVGVSASELVLSVSTYSTVGTATTYYDVASANSVGTVTRWAAEDHRHAGIGAVGISTSGNTSGTTKSVQGTYWFQAQSGITASQITSNNGSHTLNFYGPPHLSYHKLAEMADATITTSWVQSTSHMQPFLLPWNHSFDRLRLIASGSVAASSTQATTGNTSLSMTAVTSHNVVIYSRGTGASSLSLQYVTSTQIVDQASLRISYAANSTQHSYSLRFSLGSDSFTKDYSISQNSIQYHTSHLTDLTGLKILDIPFGVSLPPGMYWLAYGRSTTAATQANSISVGTRLAVSHNSMIGVSENTQGALGMLGGGSNSSVAFYPALGQFTTGGAAGTTSSVEMSAVSSNASNQVLHGQFMRIV